MKKILIILPALAAAGLFAASSVRALTLDNGLSFNGLSFNGLSFNGLSFNGLSFNGADREKSAGSVVSVILKDGERITLR
jgi:hypothetical protein